MGRCFLCCITYYMLYIYIFITGAKAFSLSTPNSVNALSSAYCWGHNNLSSLGRAFQARLFQTEKARPDDCVRSPWPMVPFLSGSEDRVAWTQESPERSGYWVGRGARSGQGRNRAGMGIVVVDWKHRKQADKQERFRNRFVRRGETQTRHTCD